MTGRIPHIRAEGSPREVGRAHGGRLKSLVESNRELYFRRFREEWGLSRDDVLDRAGKYERVIRDLAPEYAEAMEGLAEASGIPLPDIVALNVRYELVYSEYSRQGRARAATRLPSGCTGVALLPDRTEAGHLLMAQNWDWISGVRGLVVHQRLEDGPEVLGFTEAGIVGAKIGLNDAGLGLMINGLVSDQDAWDRLGAPFHVRCWDVLRKARLEDAVRLLRETPSSCSANFLLAQVQGNSGHVADVEVSPVGSNLLEPSEGFFTHANHFHRPEALGISEPLLSERPSTHRRESRLADLARDALVARRVLPSDVQDMLRDHDGHPNSICRHPDPGLPLSEQYETIASIVMDLTERSLWISQGSPCTSEYTRFGFDS